MRWEILETPNFRNNNTLIYIRFSKIEYNNLPQLGYTAKSQRKYELLCDHVKLKGD